MALALDIAKLLSNGPNGGNFGELGIDIFSYKWGRRSDQQILVIPTSGLQSPLKDLYRNPSFQILVRGNRGCDHDKIYNLAQNVYDFLVNQPENVEIDGNCYKGFDPQSDIGILGEDDNERPVFSMNFDTYI